VDAVYALVWQPDECHVCRAAQPAFAEDHTSPKVSAEEATNDEWKSQALASALAHEEDDWKRRTETTGRIRD
jgi:hypothetical protein